MNDVRIGSAVDHDMKLYRFERTSGLPRDYFDPRTTWADRFVLLACLLAVVVFLAGGFA